MYQERPTLLLYSFSSVKLLMHVFILRVYVKKVNMHQGCDYNQESEAGCGAKPSCSCTSSADKQGPRGSGAITGASMMSWRDKREPIYPQESCFYCQWSQFTHHLIMCKRAKDMGTVVYCLFTFWILYWAFFMQHYLCRWIFGKWPKPESDRNCEPKPINISTLSLWKELDCTLTNETEILIGSDTKRAHAWWFHFALWNFQFSFSVCYVCVRVCFCGYY